MNTDIIHSQIPHGTNDKQAHNLFPQRFSDKWRTYRLGEIASFFKGSGLSKTDLSLDGNGRCIHYGELYTLYGECISEVLHGTDREGLFFRSQCNDVLMPGSDVTPSGLATASCISIPDIILGGDILVIRVPAHILNGVFLAHVIRTNRNRVMKLVSGTTVFHLYGRDMANFTFAAPCVEEQNAIVAVLSDITKAITALEALLAKKRAIKQATMQQLLTGKTRLPGFSGDWETKPIGALVSHCSEKNHLGTNIPVLTCSKHLGFVDSLSYFKNQVFSKDLSNYKIIRRGQIGYPANHVEEGSIGLQDLYDVALVSPIYVVFSPNEGISSFFLHRLLKLNSYRQQFATATTSSINRRGSLRWPAFSKIRVTLPPIDEQVAIAEVLSDMETEISALENRLDKTRAIKQGMMQQLLTGKVRLVKSDVSPKQVENQ